MIDLAGLMCVQVLLCGYMAYGVIAEMIDKNYSIFCNDFVPVRACVGHR